MLAGRFIVKLPPVGQVEEAAGGAVAEATTAEMGAHPDLALLVFENIDKMIATADRTELLAGQLLQLLQLRHILPCRVIEELVVRGAPTGLADAEDHRAGHLIHDLLNIFAHIVGADVGTHAFQAAGNVVADTTGTDGITIGDHAANGHRIALVAVGHQCCAGCRGVGGAALDLADGRIIVLAPDGDIVEDVHR